MKEQFIAIASIDSTKRVLPPSEKRATDLRRETRVELTEIVAPAYAKNMEETAEKAGKIPSNSEKNTKEQDEVTKLFPNLLKDAVENETKEKKGETEESIEEPSQKEAGTPQQETQKKEDKTEEVKEQTTLQKLLSFLSELFGDHNPLVKRTEDFVQQVKGDVSAKQLAQMYIDWSIPAYAPDIPKEEKEVADIIRIEIQGIAKARGLTTDFGRAISELKYGKNAETSSSEQQKAIIDELRSLHREMVEPVVKATGALSDEKEEDRERRFGRAEEELASLADGQKRKLTDLERDTIWEAHKVGEGTGVYNFTTGQLLDKYRILKRKTEDGRPIFTPEEIRVLMEGGIVGGANITLDTGQDQITLDGIVRDPVIPAKERSFIDIHRRLADGETIGEVISVPGKNQMFDLDRMANFLSGQTMVPYYPEDHSVAGGGTLRPVDNVESDADDEKKLKKAAIFWQDKLMKEDEQWDDGKYSMAYAKWQIQKNLRQRNINSELVNKWDTDFKSSLFYRAVNLEHRSADKILDGTEALLEKALTSYNINPQNFYTNNVHLSEKQIEQLLGIVTSIGEDPQEMDRLYMMAKRNRGSGSRRRFDQRNTGSNTNNPDNPSGGGGFDNVNNGGGGGGNGNNGGGNEGGTGNGQGNGNNTGNGDRNGEGSNGEYRFDRTDNPEDPYHTPNSIQELCQEIADSAPELWGANGRFPVITGERPYRTVRTQAQDPQTGEVKTVEQRVYDPKIDQRVVNTANFVRWMRNGESGGMMYLHNDSPDENHNFLQRVGLHVRKGKLTPDINLQTILYTQDKFFRTSNHEKQYNDLVEQMKREVFFFTARRQVRIAYEIENNEMGADTKLAARIIQINAGNTFTKRIWNDESAYAHTFNLSQNYFTEADPLREEYGEKPKLPVNDGLMGKAIATAFLTYKNIADYETLQEIHNTKDEQGNTVISPFFKLETFLNIRKTLSENANINTTLQAITPQDYITDEALRNIFYMPGDKIKDKRTGEERTLRSEEIGTVKSPSAFIAYVNFYKEAEVDPRKVKLVQNLVKATLVDSADLYLKELDAYGRTVVDEYGNPIYAREKVYEIRDGKRVPKLAKDENGEYIPEWETDDTIVGGLAIRKFKEVNGQRVPARDEKGKIKYQYEYELEYEMEPHPTEKGEFGLPVMVPKKGSNGKPIVKGYKKIADSTNLDMAEAYAFTMPRPTLTAAMADTAFQAYDAGTKLLVKDYRVKSIGQQLEMGHLIPVEGGHEDHGHGAAHQNGHTQPQTPIAPEDADLPVVHPHIEKFQKNRRRRGRAYGLTKDMHQFKRLGMDFTVGAHTVVVDDEATLNDTLNKGKVKIIERNGREVVVPDLAKIDEDNVHYKTMNKIMWELHRASNKMTQDAINERHNIAFQMAFPANTEKNWAMNHIARAFEMYHRLLNATEIDFHKFSEYDPIRGTTTFKKAEFQKALGDELIKPWSYLLSTWNQLDMSQEIRTQADQYDPVTGLYTGKKWETTSVAEAMFGYEILNTEEFWADGDNIRDLYQWDKVVENGREVLKVKRDPRGEPLRKLDPYKINAQKDILYIQIVKTILAAQFAEARDKYSGHKAYELSYWNHIYEALEAIPMFLEGDEFSMLNTRATGHFFTHHDIEWIRKHSRSESGRLYLEAYRRAFALGFGGGLGKAGAKIIQGITAGLM